LDPVVQERENAARRELHLDPVVHERENAARQEIHGTERLDPVIREREHAARREIHGTERLDPVVQEHENADRRRRQENENNEIGRGAITDINMSMEDFIYRIRNDKNGECFSIADKNVNNALTLFYANMGYHKFGQYLKFC
jgi:chemotaxis regulatin CheY-phosphate phosphatase CheZ